MVNVAGGTRWQRTGVSLIWKPEFLHKVSPQGDTLSLREFYAMKEAWPDALPLPGGKAVAVSGLEGMLDILDDTNAESWLQQDFRHAILSFQDNYGGDCALIFWLPNCRNRFSFDSAQERYLWKRRGASTENMLQLGRLIYAGAETELERITDSGEPDADSDRDAWAGLYHPRIS